MNLPPLHRRALRRAGQFNSSGEDGADSGSGVCGESLASGLWQEALSADEGQAPVAQVSEDLRSGAGADAAGVLGEGAVADAEEAVLDLPVIAGELQEGGGIEPRLGQAGDGVDDLARAQGLGLPAALDAADAPETRPVLVEAGGQPRAHRDEAGLDAAVRLLDRRGAPQIRRVDAPLRGARQGGEA